MKTFYSLLFIFLFFNVCLSHKNNLRTDNKNSFSFSAGNEYTNGYKNGVTVMESVWKAKPIKIETSYRSPKIVHSYNLPEANRFKERASTIRSDSNMSNNSAKILETPVFHKRTQEGVANTEVSRVTNNFQNQNNGIDESKFEMPEIRKNTPAPATHEEQAKPVENNISAAASSELDNKVSEILNRDVKRPKHKKQKQHHGKKRGGRKQKQAPVEVPTEQERKSENIRVKERNGDVFLFGNEFNDLEDEILDKIMQSVDSNNNDIAKSSEAKRVFGIHRKGPNELSVNEQSEESGNTRDSNYKLTWVDDNKDNQRIPQPRPVSQEPVSSPQPIQQQEVSFEPIHESPAPVSQAPATVAESQNDNQDNKPSNQTKENKPQKIYSDFKMPEGYITPKSEGSSRAPHYTII